MVLIKVKNNEGKTVNEGKFRPFFFVLYGDVQYGMIRGNHGWPEERKLLKEAIIKTNKIKPPFVITLGDLANKFPIDEVQDHQYKDFRNDLEKLDKSIDMYVFCGNHDVGNEPTHETIENFEKLWGDAYYSYIYNNCGFIILNSALCFNDTKVQDLKEKQFLWLEETLKKMVSKNVKHKFLFLHHALMYDHIEEDENIGLIYSEKFHNYTEKNKFHIKKENRTIIYDMLKKYKVNHVFCAHLHANRENNIDANIKQITISAVGMQAGNDQSGLMIVQVAEEGVDYKYYPFEFVPSFIKV
ncbi:serine/threonine protein phosphatase CPPED1, putative [Plasmodium knowlesi strain H]|uniref:Serine/threonine protein phosphatase CPPED1, putative n=3 Tax=Plasmodium knowlesi TaxID=5850 RepID=A0A5K1VAG1_PLAKH|nr:serine/threonine protein phosphatase CPPED1, putative [Plasmodium knowlesi strain H]OTN67885.1 putative Acid phosphatase [Plasmodium knowlesi]CAA9990568.1 serine/threonine protein phosphatase CPPED1, putative [Plasmodium knowlesi strain H]SBO19834.1 serine/threonine protein phosphatase CPPED1, putative [Plasmodium knowlesi strain H]SBO22344.1 serine/threonine protein phosphatase CPPED1, putative [Plasmodium knowlesi strain H]VVS80042.1 serine/threonine protein phosphatase CPPED1, putative [|eukprot:XP_002260953.1 acid phosphatase, putative [Plasmodium knowlesi strain H]